jgi:hypothetical protein
VEVNKTMTEPFLLDKAHAYSHMPHAPLLQQDPGLLELPTFSRMAGRVLHRQPSSIEGCKASAHQLHTQCSSKAWVRHVNWMKDGRQQHESCILSAMLKGNKDNFN